MKPSLCRAARTRCVRSRFKRSRRARMGRTDQRPINAEADGMAASSTSPKPTTPTHLPTHNTRVKPTREAGSAWTTCYARQVNPKPLACNGSGRTGSTEERSASSGQVEASKDRSRQRRQSEGHETILVPSGANAVHPKPSEAKPEGESEPNRSVTDQRRRQRRNVSR